MSNIDNITQIIQTSVSNDVNMKLGKKVDYSSLNKLIEAQLKISENNEVMKTINTQLAKLLELNKKLTILSPTLVLFYDKECKHSNNFIPTWNKIKTLLPNVRMFSLNGKNEKNNDIYDFFKIAEYPSIKLITSDGIYDYADSLTVNNIVSFVRSKTT